MNVNRAVPKWLAVIVVGLLLFATVTAFFNPAQAAPTSNPASQPPSQPASQAVAPSSDSTGQAAPASVSQPQLQSHRNGQPGAVPPPARVDSLLYDQYNNAGGNATLSQQFGDSPTFNSQTGDDFVVPAGQSWSINELDAQGTYFNGAGPATGFNVFIYNSVVSGTYTIPGAAVYTATNLAYTSVMTNFMIILVTPAILSSGSYFVSPQAVMNFTPGGEWGWQDRAVQTNGPASFRNEGGGFGGGCTNWDERGFCAGDPSNPDQVYRLQGALTTQCGGNPSLSFAPATNFSVGNGPHSVAVGDFNGDGKPDLVTANSSSANVSVLLGNGAGSFGAAANFAVGNVPSSVAVGDFNGDGKLDLAVANYNDDNVSILLGNGSGGFGTATSFAVSYSPESVAVGDFNGDGKLDLATANFNDMNVSVLLGNGAGSFGTATNFNVGNRPESVAVGDFNGDGKLDLAVANFNDNNVSVLLGNGDGSFGAATNFAVGNGPTSVVVGDFNGDGKLDLVTTNFTDNNVSILLGNGAGSFGAATNFAAGNGPQSVAVGDFNGDGKLDLVTTNFYDGNVSVLLGNGNGGFGAATNFAVGTHPYAVVGGDFNSDGRLDLAAANNGSNNVSALLNTTTCPSFTPTSTPLSTNTAVPATATSTPLPPTSTPRPPTSTPLPPTSTPLPPTQTPGGATATPAPSNTAVVPTVTPTDCANVFVDVTGNIFYPAIHYLNCRGVVNGTDATHYSPAGTSTRGQFAKVVVLGFGTPFFTPAVQDFVDVPPSYFAYTFIESGFHAGILSGFDPGTCAAHGLGTPCYLPNQPITRGQLTKLVVNAGGYTLLTPAGGVPDFVDVPADNVFYVSIETAFHSGIVNGYSNHTFRPNNNIRRDEMAQIVFEGVINRP